MGRNLKTYIHVNKHVLDSNRKNNLDDPPITVKTYQSNNYCHEVEISGPSRIMYSKDKPLSCGATVYVVADSADVKIIK